MTLGNKIKTRLGTAHKLSFNCSKLRYEGLKTRNAVIETNNEVS